MNMSHMKKREFTECEESLIKREAISVEALAAKRNTGKAAGAAYVGPG